MKTTFISAVIPAIAACGAPTRGNQPDGPPGTSESCISGTSRCSAADAIQQCVGGQWQTTSCGQDFICTDGQCEACPKIEFSVQTTQSCALQTTTPVDAEAFITLEGQQHRIMAMNRWGEGHIFAWCDWSSFGQIMSQFDVFAYAGQVANPRVLAFGDPVTCDPASLMSGCYSPPDVCVPLPANVTYTGIDLPPQYANNPAGLAADWDVAVFCGFNIPWTTDWSDEIHSFVSEHGKGLVAIGEFDTYVQAVDFPQMTTYTSPSGIVFQQLNLNWAPSSSNVVLDCVPDVGPIE